MRTLGEWVGDALRLARILPPMVGQGEEDKVNIKELADADREGEERLKRASKNLGPLRRGEITEEDFYRRALDLGGDDEED